ERRDGGGSSLSAARLRVRLLGRPCHRIGAARTPNPGTGRHDRAKGRNGLCVAPQRRGRRWSRDPSVAHVSLERSRSGTALEIPLGVGVALIAAPVCTTPVMRLRSGTTYTYPAARSRR